MTSNDKTDAARQAVEDFWTATEARAERRGVTEPTRSLAPNCPEWCNVTHHSGDLDFELDHNDALFRWHCGRTNVVEESPRNAAPGRRPGSVEWWTSVAEYLDGSHGPTTVDVDATGMPSLTPDQARKLARGLLEAADQAEQGTVTE